MSASVGKLPQRAGSSVDVARVHALIRSRRSLRAAQAWGRTLRPSQHDQLPHFVIIGAQRCGTTSLYEYLIRHPQVSRPLLKEVQFFSLHYQWGLRWYRSCFPRVPADKQTFEASPYYVFDPDVPARVAAALPDTRFVLLIRDPVKRAHSHYQHSLYLGQETLSFPAAVAAETGRLQRAKERGGAAGHRALQAHSYLARGRYAEQLQRWYEYMDPARIKVISSEALFATPECVLDDLLEFLGLDRRTDATLTQSNQHRRHSDSDLVGEVRRDLVNYFAPHNAQLVKMLGWQPDWA